MKFESTKTTKKSGKNPPKMAYADANVKGTRLPKGGCPKGGKGKSGMPAY
jgi:hypothetical protein